MLFVDLTQVSRWYASVKELAMEELAPLGAGEASPSLQGPFTEQELKLLLG